jgi:flagella basal body P-ring formation protein FlgA
MSTTTARYAGVLARASLLPLTMLLPLAAAAQGVGAGQGTPGMPDGMIMIPGNGEPGVAAPRGGMPAPRMRGTTATVPARAADADAAFENAARNAQIVIPGNGEPGAPGTTLSQIDGQISNQATGQTPRLVQNNRSNVSAVTINPTTDRRSTQLADSPSISSLAPAAETGTLETRATSTPATEAAEPPLHPAVAALLAQRSTEPAAPRSALVQLQKQAATELGRDTAAHGAATETSSGTAGQAAPGHSLSLANAPTARSMPALDTIPAGQILGAVRPPGSRVQSVVVNRPARNLDAATETATAANETRNAPGAQAQIGTPSNFAVETTPGAGAVERVALRAPGNDPATGARDAIPAVTVASDAPRAQAKGPKEIPVNVVTTVPANAPPIAHSVVVAAPPAVVAAAATAPVLPGKQDPAVIMKTAEDFLRQQATGLPGRVTLTVPPIAPRGLAACDNLQAFMAPGAPMWGRTTVGVRCTGEKPWTIYLLARVSVQATYYVAGRSISPGDVIQMADLVPREGDLSVMPRAIVTDPSQVIGAVAENRISAGLPLRSDLIRSPQAIQLGQTVKVVAQGDGFSISTDGNAMNNASPGQQVRVKTSSGQTVVGTASGKGVVQIPM